eukprot:gnl/MRDRNA2_/MRDRNA2_113146_c0_seq1.p1 gnl/MRDRNA2_/MRDRNA2_113146_c0~~gnl/MRDRNA2_/MRDRNA2_113146_c0_seq1.p1  ORF type:complete len:355 (+),score=63.30 gnl/MRDRNA2_/MRDRNA2_113146_c0_seq1:69-1133(+)
MMKLLCVFLFHTCSVEALRRLSPHPDQTVQWTKTDEYFDQIMRIFGTGEDMHEGEIEYLMTLLKEAGVGPQDYKDLFSEEGIFYNMTGHMKTLHRLAIQEELALGKDYGPGKISDFGNAVPKYPRSWVEKIVKLNDTKEYRYMFSGSVTKGRVEKNRAWLAPWVKSHFNDEDYFRATDSGHGRGYTPWGKYDHTATDTGGFRPKNCGGACMEFDETYWSQMVKSKFILAPGGDAPYSFRFHEAFLAGCIPIINSFEHDWLPRMSTKWISMIRYDFGMTDEYPHKFDVKIARKNRRKFIRYQTFLEGENDPVKDLRDGTYQRLFGRPPENKKQLRKELDLPIILGATPGDQLAEQ